VVVSARVLESDQAAARAAGADDFLCKPFNLKRLTSTIQPFLASA
jgi:DNA-binding response OmpR family regulator